MNYKKIIMQIYNRVPIGIINAFAFVYRIIPDKYRLGAAYLNEAKEIKRIHSLSEKEITNERNRRLRQLVAYAYKHVEYYRDLFDKNGLNPGDIKTVKDLNKIPFLTKELLMKNRDRLISDEYKTSDLVYITTSGSTGQPAGFFVDKNSHIRDWAYVYSMFKSYGYNTGSSKLLLRGKTFYSQKKGKLWQWDALKRELSVNIFEMTEDNLELYCKKIEKYKPDFAYGYMSAMYSLCKYIKHRKGGLNHHFKAFIGISETIYEEQRILVENVINAPVLTFYGMSERVIIAGQKKSGGIYYIEPMYGIAELIDDRNNVINEIDKKGEIVGTSLLNFAMPLIRYRMGDVSSWAKSESSDKTYQECFSDIFGRKRFDVLISKDKTPISMASLEVHSELYSYIFRYQFVQHQIGKVVIKIVLVPDCPVPNNFSESIQKLFQERAKGKIDFSVKIVDAIKPKANGKLSIIDQHLDVREYI